MNIEAGAILTGAIMSSVAEFHSPHALPIYADSPNPNKSGVYIEADEFDGLFSLHTRSNDRSECVVRADGQQLQKAHGKCIGKIDDCATITLTILSHAHGNLQLSIVQEASR